jgi:hypothetical protein
MRPISTLLRTFLVMSAVAAAASAIAAFVARGRMASSGGPADDELDLVAIYEGLDFTSAAPALRRVAVIAWYGGGTLDLRGATLDPAGAVMTVRAIFGGYRLVIPETWRVELRARGVFGGIGDGRKADLVDPNGPLLTIEGFAIFGGVGIVSEAPDLEKAADAMAETLPVEAIPLPA